MQFLDRVFCSEHKYQISMSKSEAQVLRSYRKKRNVREFPTSSGWTESLDEKFTTFA